MHKTVSDGEETFQDLSNLKLMIALYSNLNLLNSNRKESWKDNKKTQKIKAFAFVVLDDVCTSELI